MTTWPALLKKAKSDSSNYLTSVSKKSGQTTVVIQYYSLSRFFWNRRYHSILDLDSVQQLTFQRDGKKLAVQIKARINGKETVLSKIRDEDKDEASIFLTTIVELSKGDMVSCEKELNSKKHFHTA